MSRREEGGDFLGRWSARKLKARTEPPEAAPAPEPAAPVEPAPEMTEAEFLAEHGLPEPEALGKGDDFSAFLRETVPAALRRRALRRLWLTDPVFANVDGLVEYGEDYTDAATAMKEVKSLYQVGKGMLRDADDQEPAAAVAPLPTEQVALAPKGEGQVAEAEAPAPVAEPAAERDAPANASLQAALPPGECAPEAEAAPEPTRPRRMRFRFGG